MPFTVSHAVVALPFVRTPLVAAAITIGAMTPDLPLFVRAGPLTYALTHSLAGIPVTMLVALFLLLIWRCVLRPATRELAPRFLARRLPARWDQSLAAGFRETFATAEGAVVAHSAAAPRPQRQTGRWRGPLLLVVSLAVGVLSHIVWDSFTHEGRWGSAAVPALDERWGPLDGYKWLQYGSSVIGLLVIGVWAILWLARRRITQAPHLMPAAIRWVWWLLLPGVLAAAWLWGLAQFGPFTAEWTIAHLAYRVLPPACAVWGITTVILCAAVQIVQARPLTGEATAPGRGRTVAAGGSRATRRKQDQR